MYYYDPNDRRPRRWAVFVTTCYVLLLGTSFAFVSFDFSRPEASTDEIIIEFIEPEQVTPPPPPPRRVVEPRVHEKAAPVKQTAQVEGADNETRTPNPNALFAMNKGGVDEPENAGNPHAREGEDKASGTGPGLSADGFDQLDKGLQGRGLAGDLPRPSYPGTKSGKVVVRVTVDGKGAVTSATFEPTGSTTTDPALVKAAVEAARKARFTESRAVVQGGTITYLFRIKAN
ncbi:MAG: energy transducer TonB [Alistipes sp.]|nr:energy transducer TonB [Alistipes sp.]